MKTLTALSYIGDGAYRPGVPTSDMDRASIEHHARQRGLSVDEYAAELVGSGLFLPVHVDDEPEEAPEEADEPEEAPKAAEESDGSPEATEPAPEKPARPSRSAASKKAAK